MKEGLPNHLIIPIEQRDGCFYAPNGLPSHYESMYLQKLIRSREFIAWFGNWHSQEGGVSKACYQDTGEPILFSHRTNVSLPAGMLSVDRDKTFGTEHGLRSKALYFSTDDLREYGQFIHRGFLNLRNPSMSWESDASHDGCMLYFESKGRVGCHAAIFFDDQFMQIPDREIDISPR